MKLSQRLVASAAGLSLAAGGFVAFGAATPAGAAEAPVAPSYAAYNGSAAEQKANEAFFEAVMDVVAEKRKKNPGAAVTVTYDASGAPTFAAQIAKSTQIWNASVANVQLQEGSGGDFEYREGNDPRGSYASTDGHGRGYIFLDYKQNEQYDSTRVTAHETGHVLGLPDTYDGPCSQLMSGGGPGTSCTNAQPDAEERAEVERLWANGFEKALHKVNAR